MKFNYEFERQSENGFLLYKCENLNARIDILGDSLLRVAVFPDGEELLPTFCIDPDSADLGTAGRERLSVNGFSAVTINLQSSGECDFFTLPCGIKVTVNRKNFLLKYEKNGQTLFADRAPLAYNFDGEFGKGMFHYVSREDGERIFGLGDKCGSLNKSGNSYRIETTDPMGYNAGTTDPLYKHVPFYICENSVGSYGIFYDTSDTSYFDFGKEINNYYEPYKYFKTQDNALVYYIFFGTNLEIVKQFSHVCGKQMLPPRKSFDYCASTMAYTDAPDSENQMNLFLEKLESLDLNCTGFYLSSGYTSIGTQRYVFNWNTEKFPNPEQFVERFQSKGVDLIPNIKPAFLCDHPMYREIAEKGLFVKNSDGTPFITRFWDGQGSYLDFTNPHAREFWIYNIKDKLLDKGIKYTWNDNNEFDIKDEGACAFGFGNTVKASRIRPTLTYLMVYSSYLAQIEKYPKLRPFISTRSGNIGIRRFAQTWSGDNSTDWNSLKYCHYIGLTMSLSGFYFYGHDLGGFSGEMPSRELLLRWLQLGLFEPRFTIHSWNSDGSATMPWSYPDIIPYVKEIFAQRKKLVPYLYNCAHRAVEYDEPINSPVFLYYDGESRNSDLFLVGRNILVAPVLEEGQNDITVNLPKGDSWYFDGTVFEGGASVQTEISAFGKMKYFVRCGSVIPYNTASGFNDDENLVLTVYPIKNGTFKDTFFYDDGKTFDYLENKCVNLNITVECDENSVTVFYENSGDTPFEPEFALAKGDNRMFTVRRRKNGQLFII
ncbi:MAG: hypothetical protein J1F37_03120 [Oscillospiraceae bacterium]|nr:hypothetical protein [Oscillospiraceae bacterium]